jgi:putative acetyltransferase
MDYTIREMHIDDYDRLISLWQRCEGIGLSDADQLERIDFFLRRNPGMSFVAEGADGAMAGAVLCGTDGRRGYLHHLAVDPAWRRHGIGAARARR